MNFSWATIKAFHAAYIFYFLQFQGEVNCVKWDPTGSWLASCSDDISAKVIICAFFSCHLYTDLQFSFRVLYLFIYDSWMPYTNLWAFILNIIPWFIIAYEPF
jgi:hypothetical protein